jgi:hypothetical protein
VPGPLSAKVANYTETPDGARRRTRDQGKTRPASLLLYESGIPTGRSADRPAALVMHQDAQGEMGDRIDDQPLYTPSTSLHRPFLRIFASPCKLTDMPWQQQNTTKLAFATNVIILFLSGATAACQERYDRP